MSAGLFYFQEKLGKTAPHRLVLAWQITAAKTASSLPMGNPSLIAFDAVASQAVIDAFLGTTNEFLVAAFDATAMGNDMFAAIVDMKGQMKDLVGVNTRCFSAYATAGSEAEVSRFAPKSASLTASSATTQAAVGANGNLAFRVNFGNTPDFDGLTDAFIVSEILWISK